MKRTDKDLRLNLCADAEFLLDAIWNNEDWTWTGFAQYWRKKLGDPDYEEMTRCLGEEV